MRRTVAIVAALLVTAGLGGCDKDAGATKAPGADTAGLEQMEGKPAGPAGTGAQDAQGKQADQALPKVRDRDPEEEKRKMAQSRQKSGQAKKLLRSGQLDQAVLESRASLKIHEQNVEAMLVISEVFFRQGKYELTLAVTNSALAVDAKVRTPQESSKAYNMRGFAHAAMGNDQAATEAFKQAAEADEKNAAAWNNLGTRYLDAGDYRTAISCFNYALELQPSFAKAHMNLGAAHRAQRKWKDAEKSLLKALDLRKNYAEAYFNLGLLYLDADPFPGLETNGRLGKAIQYLTKYKNTPSPPDPASAAEVGGRNRKVRGKPGSKPGPAPVSKERADDYIRVAQKGLDREKRRLEREKKRQGKGAGASAGSDPAKPTEATSNDAKPGSSAPPPASPTKPTGSAPAKPTPAKPTQPKPAKPTQPTPAKPAPAKPAPAKPQGPAKQPTPAPQKPAPQKPAPQKPAPQKPGPQKPGSQKSASAGNPLEFADTKASGLLGRSAENPGAHSRLVADTAGRVQPSAVTDARALFSSRPSRVSQTQNAQTRREHSKFETLRRDGVPTSVARNTT